LNDDVIGDRAADGLCSPLLAAADAEDWTFGKHVDLIITLPHH